MENNAAAIWSAVAASFAALSSLLILRVQRHNLLEAARPELVLTGWTRHQETTANGVRDRLRFSTIRNVGRGVALNVYIHSPVDDPPIVILSTTRHPVIGANEKIEANEDILMWWNSVKADDNGHKHLFFRIVIWCWDSRGMRHETRYNLFVVEVSKEVGVADAIAPGVSLISRTTSRQPVWWLKLKGNIKRLPGVGRVFPKEEHIRPLGVRRSVSNEGTEHE